MKLKDPIFVMILCMILTACHEAHVPLERFGSYLHRDRTLAAYANAAAPEKLHLTVQHEVGLTKCNLERLTALDANTIGIAGWIVDIKNDRVPKIIYLQFHDAKRNTFWIVKVVPDIARPDVATFFGANASFARSGFNATVNTSRLGSGPFNVQLIYPYAGSFYSCGDGKSTAPPI